MKKFTSIILLLMLFSCEMVVDIKVPEPKPKITLNAFFNTDSVWTAELMKDKFILDNKPYHSINDALVIIYQDGIPIDTLMTTENSGQYRSDTGKPLQQVTYEIRATSPAYGSVFASSHIPAPVTVEKAELILPDEPVGNDPKIKMNIVFTDPAGKNFYEIKVVAVNQYIDQVTGEEHLVRRPIGIESDDPLIDNEVFNSYESVFFNDRLFGRKETSIRLSTPYWGEMGTADWWDIYLISHSEDLYHYKTTALLQQRISDDPYAQPVNVYNNIHKGVGVFAGFSQSIKTLQHPRTANPPVIHSFTPTKGHAGDTVTISGDNFGTEIYDNWVTFNGRSSNIYSATANELVVIVPKEATTGLIAVMVSSKSKTAVSKIPFEVLP
jgi:hypothetical protein